MREQTGEDRPCGRERAVAQSSAAQPDGENISVILPVYLQEPGADAVEKLDRAVRSVWDQSYPADMELVVVDDGSPVAVSDHLACPPDDERMRLTVVRLARNGGIVNALNTGLAAARHPLIARIDADDEWLDGKIAAQIDCLRGDARATIIGTGMWIVYEWGGMPQPGQRWRGGWHDALRFAANQGCPFPHGSILARRDVFTALGGYSGARAVRHAEDFALWSVWLRFFRPAMPEGIFYRYSASPASVSARHFTEQQRASARIRANNQKLQLADIVPDAMAELADALGLTEMQAGVLALRLWRQQPAFAAPETAIAPLRRLLPDRKIAEALFPRLKRPARLCDLLAGFDPPEAMTDGRVWTVRRA